MKRSTNHILTTHTGSLPRPTDLVDMVLRKEQKQAVDEDDGEQGKPGYSTYMKDRLTGFEG